MASLIGPDNIRTFRTRSGGEPVELSPGKAPAGGGVTAERWLALYRKAVEAEECLRSTLPHTLANPSMERVARAALANISELGEYLLRQKVVAEQHEQGEESSPHGLWSIKTAAQWMELSDDKVRKMVDNGVLPHVTVDGVLRIPAALVLAFIEANTHFGRV